MNGNHSVIFEAAPKYCISDSLVDYEGYSVSSMGFLPTVVDIMDIWIKICPCLSILVHWFLGCQCLFLLPLAWPHPILLDSWTYDIPGSCTILFFAASGFTFITRPIHNWVLYLLWPSHFIHSGATGNSLLFPSSILDTFGPGGLIFWCHIGLPFIQFMKFLWQVYWGGLPFSPPVDHFWQNSLLWLIHLGWPFRACLTASLSYTSPSPQQGSDPWRGNVYFVYYTIC